MEKVNIDSERRFSRGSIKAIDFESFYAGWGTNAQPIKDKSRKWNDWMFQEDGPDGPEDYAVSIYDITMAIDDLITRYLNNDYVDPAFDDGDMANIIRAYTEGDFGLLWVWNVDYIFQYAAFDEVRYLD